MSDKAPLGLGRLRAAGMVGLVLALWVGLISLRPAIAADPPAIRAGSELDFRPYCFTDSEGQPMGMGVELLQAVAEKMGLQIHVSPGPWDQVWTDLVAGKLDVLPVVARTPGREPLVDFSLPHTETFDAFFRRKGQPAWPSLAAAAGQEVVVLRSDAAHHELLERKFVGTVIPVDSIPEGLRLVASGKHHAFLCSKLIGVLEAHQAGIGGIEPGPPIPDYKRVFSFAVRKGNTELVEKLNQGLLLVKSDGTYDRIYRKWLTVEDPWRRWVPYVQWLVVGLLGLVGLVAVLQWMVQRRTRQLAAEVAERRKAQAALEALNTTLEQRVTERTADLQESDRNYQALFNNHLNGMCYGQVLLDERGRAVDYRFLDANDAFAAMTGWSKEATLGHTARELMPGIESAPFDFIGVHGRVALTGEPATFEVYQAHLERWYSVFVYSPKKTCFISMFSDITERKRAEEAVRESEERLRLTLESGMMGTFEIDLRTGAGRWNTLEFELLGLRPGEAPANAETFFRFVHPDDVGQLKTQWDQATRSGVLDAEFRIVRADGQERWLAGKGRFAFEDGADRTTQEARRAVRFLGVNFDITQRKRVEEELRESEARLRTLTEAGFEGIVIVEQGRIVECNRQFAAMHGYSAEEVTGQPASRFIHPEDLGRAAAAMAAGRESLGTYRDLKKDGSEIIVEARGHTTMWHGRRVRFIALQDITARQRAEEALVASRDQLQKVIDNTTGIVYALDLEELFVMANASLAKLLNSTPEQMIGKRRHAFMPKEDAEWHEANDRQVIEAGRALEFEEFSQLQGRTITWLTTKFPLRDTQGRIYAVAGISADISARKQAEDALKAATLLAEEAKGAAETASKAKDQFLAVLSHELRTPLTPALMLVAAQEKNPEVPEAVRQDLTTVRHNLDLEVRIIDDLLDLSRVTSGKMRMHLQTVSVQEVLRRAIGTCAVDIAERNLQFRQEWAAQQDQVQADPARLQQVFWNLLKNAVKFTPEGGCLAVTCHNTSDGKVQVQVQDTGMGIAPDALARIFDAFEQADQSITRQFGGLGLGLAISKAIVDLHHGTIRAESPGKGQGATFTVTLAVAKTVPAASLPAGSPRAEAARGRTLRLLLVEDHADTAWTLARLLRAAGHEVQTAGSVATALACLAREPFDLLLSDLGLPDGTGYELMQQAGERYGLAGVCMSGFGMEADIEKGRAVGFAAHLTKPISFEQLQQTIKQVLRA